MQHGKSTCLKDGGGREGNLGRSEKALSSDSGPPVAQVHAEEANRDAGKGVSPLSHQPHPPGTSW